ncbi:Hypothetical Protein OBI_RACECAR_238 [Arthrobacter phage Racecar]|nr:hypothetical protein PBI_RACECAR_30 [Arthrobacter phage Racecar]QFG12714.1 hypothetical protein PBI_MIMI_30 [Arthrobacter phage Mimi]
MAKFKEDQLIVVSNHPAIRSEYVGRRGIIKQVLPAVEGRTQTYIVDLFGRREEGINPNLALLGIYFREVEIELEDATEVPEKELTNIKALLKDIDTEIKDVQDAAHRLQKWGFVDQGTQASYAAGTYSRIRDRFVQALKEDGVDIEQ